MTEFFIDMLPPTSTHQERGCIIENGKRKYYDRNNGEARQKLKAYLAKYRPECPSQGAVQLVVKWCFPLKGKHLDGQPFTNRPDADNLCKTLLDVMTELGYWKDDSKVYSLVCEKFWAKRPGIYIRIKEVREND
jgi:Holliday junction resolvase RusA-like endonuclease